MPIVLPLKKKTATGPAKPIPAPSIPPDVLQLIREVGALQDEALMTAQRIRLLQAHMKLYVDKVCKTACKTFQIPGVNSVQ